MQDEIQCRKNLVWNAGYTGVQYKLNTKECTTQLSREQGVVKWDANNGGHLPSKLISVQRAVERGCRCCWWRLPEEHHTRIQLFLGQDGKHNVRHRP